MLAAAYSRGRQPPKPIREAPQLQIGLDLYWTAFWELSSCRALGFGGAGQIPWTALDRYCVAKEIDRELRETLMYLVRAMDAEYLEWQNKKSKTK